MAAEQSLKSHTRWDPLFHFVLGPIFLLNIAFVVLWYLHHRGLHAHSGPWAIVVAVALFLMLLKTRMYALKVQDRVIRMEERSRLAALAPAGELAELESLTMDQYVGLRFASNAELPALARRAVRERLNRKQIKEAIVAWRPDNDRV